MKTAILQPVDKLKMGFGVLLSKLSAFFLVNHVSDTSATRQKNSIGNYFAGPHCVFDPRLLK